jgi:transcriptional regulator with XRE-family HTH domain
MRRLRLRRVLVGMSQAELARRVGKSPAWLSLVERGYLRPETDMLARLKASLKDGGDGNGRG